MEQTPPVRRRRRREREWPPIELGFFFLTVLLALVMTVTGVAMLVDALRGDQPAGTVTVGQTDGDTQNRDDEASAQSGQTDGGETDSESAESADTSDLAQYAGASGYAGQLYALLEDHPEAAYVLRNLSLYPDEILDFVIRYPEAMPFAASYPDYINGNLSLEIDLSEEGASDTVPLLIQWDSRWAYRNYGDGLFGYTGCGPTCLSMVALYLNGWDNNDPYTIAQYADENGYYYNGSGSAWTLMSEASAHFGLTATELTLDENRIIEALESGEPVVCAMGEGDFTDNGHFIVLTGYTEGQGFTVNDPNSPSNSARTWTFDEISDQINNLWSFRSSEG